VKLTRPTVVVLAASAVILTAAEDFESPPKLRAADVLPQEALLGPHHSVEDRVVSDGVALAFRIRSDFGDFEAPSREMAELRIAEVAVIARLRELESSDVFADALAASVKKKAEAVQRVVEDPEGTVKATGKGLKRLFGKGRKAAEDLAEAAREDDDAKKPENQPSTSDKTKELLGVNKAKRQIAKSVGADPYSSNPVLQEELERLAQAAVAGGLTGSLGVKVPGVDQVASVGNLAWDLPPEDLKARNETSLEAMGCDDGTAKRLYANAAYSPSLVTALVTALENLEGLQDRPVLAKLAAGAANEVEARFYRSSLNLLAAARSKGHDLKTARAYGRAPAVLAADGTLIIAAAVDLLIWQEGLREAVERPVPEAKARALWVTGRLTKTARTELQGRGWKLHEGVSAPPFLK
jgi:hypothetical protein